MEILEHKILEVLYKKAGFSTTATGIDGKMIPIYKRHYGFNRVQFGVLADLIHNPDKYLLSERLMSIQRKIVTREEVNISHEEWYELSDAVEVLSSRKQVTDEGADNPYDVQDRHISLTIDGVLAYKKKEYLREYEEEEILNLKNKITRIELKQKRYWLRNDLIKTGCAAILGALIASFPKLWGWHKESPEQTLTQVFEDTINVKVAYPTNYHYPDTPISEGLTTLTDSNNAKNLTKKLDSNVIVP